MSDTFDFPMISCHSMRVKRIVKLVFFFLASPISLLPSCLLMIFQGGLNDDFVHHLLVDCLLIFCDLFFSQFGRIM